MSNVDIMRQLSCLPFYLKAASFFVHMSGENLEICSATSMHRISEVNFDFEHGVNFSVNF